MSRRQYKISKLIDGFRVDTVLKGLQLVAIPKHKIHPALLICFENGDTKELMRLDRVGIVPLKEIEFTDQYGRKDDNGKPQTYTLCYYEWIPQQTVQQKALF